MVDFIISITALRNCGLNISSSGISSGVYETASSTDVGFCCVKIWVYANVICATGSAVIVVIILGNVTPVINSSNANNEFMTTFCRDFVCHVSGELLFKLFHTALTAYSAKIITKTPTHTMVNVEYADETIFEIN